MNHHGNPRSWLKRWMINDCITDCWWLHRAWLNDTICNDERRPWSSDCMIWSRLKWWSDSMDELLKDQWTSQRIFTRRNLRIPGFVEIPQLQLWRNPAVLTDFFMAVVSGSLCSRECCHRWETSPMPIWRCCQVPAIVWRRVWHLTLVNQQHPRCLPWN